MPRLTNRCVSNAKPEPMDNAVFQILRVQLVNNLLGLENISYIPGFGIG
jgi:hypothetical protein